MTLLRESATTPLVALDRGWFLMGGQDAAAYVRLEPFYLSACCVSNERFAAFVAATDYVTDAERAGWSLVFAGLPGGEHGRADGHPATAPVTAYSPNRFGLFDMTGNVWEWTADWYRAGAKALRGGSYLCSAADPDRYQVSARTGLAPGFRAGDVGFLCARSV